MAKLSVILPVYNGGEFLEKCIESVRGQTFTDWELLCVDDGSTDDSAQILECFRKKDARIRVITQKNSGVAAARQAGLQAADGDCVTFLDQDDSVEAGMYETLLHLWEAQKADLAVCGYTKVFADHEEPMRNRKEIAGVTDRADQWLTYAFFREEYRNFASFVWNKIFSMEVIRKNGLRFAGDLRRGDDILFFTEYALCAKRCVYTPKHFYRYSVREDSTSHTVTAEHLDVFDGILTGYARAIAAAEAGGKIGEETLDHMRTFTAFHAGKCLRIALEGNDGVRGSRYAEELRRYFPQYCAQNAGYPERIAEMERLLNEADRLRK